MLLLFVCDRCCDRNGTGDPGAVKDPDEAESVVVVLRIEVADDADVDEAREFWRMELDKR